MPARRKTTRAKKPNSRRNSGQVFTIREDSEHEAMAIILSHSAQSLYISDDENCIAARLDPEK